MKHNLDEIEAAARAATPGKWSREHDEDYDIESIVIRHDEDNADIVLEAQPCMLDGKDAAHIALASPDAVLWLVGEVRRLRKHLKPICPQCNIETSVHSCGRCGCFVGV